ncbi:MAG: PilN domain-containing protein [Phycisphaerales bacterium]
MSQQGGRNNPLGNATRTTRAGAATPAEPSRIAAIACDAKRATLVLLHDRRIILAESASIDAINALIRRAAERGMDQIVSLIPADRAICKPVATPVGDPAEIQAALALLAEAELPSRIPSHRRAWGRIQTPAPNGDGLVRGILTGWVPDAASANQPEDPVDQALNALTSASAGNDKPKQRQRAPQRHWLPEPVALFALLDPSGGSLAWSTTGQSARTAAAAIGRDGIIARSIRITPSADPAATARDQADAAAASVAITAPLQTASVDRLASAIAIDSGTLERLCARIAFASPSSNPPITPDWLAEFAPTLGAALLATERLAADPTDPLFSIRPDPPTKQRTALDRATAALARPAVAALAIAAGIAVALLFPWAAATLERATLQARAATLEQRLSEATGARSSSQSLDELRDNPVRYALASWRESDDVTAQLALYRAVRQLRWPLTKLLADASAALPIGADLDSIQLAVGERIVLRGVADDQQIVNEFVQTLNTTGVFTGGVLDRSQRRDAESTSRPVEFQVTVQIANPYAEARSLESNYAETPLAVILYGERAREFLNTPGATEGTKFANPAAARPRPTTPKPTGASSPSSTPASTPAAPPADPPAVADADPTSGSDQPAADRPDRRAAFERPGETPSEPDPIPEPITQEQVAALDDAALRDQFVKRRLASTRRDIEDADRQRLEEEVEMFRAELQKRRGA